jgi:hypothetical protein
LVSASNEETSIRTVTFFCAGTRAAQVKPGRSRQAENHEKIFRKLDSSA